MSLWPAIAAFTSALVWAAVGSVAQGAVGCGTFPVAVPGAPTPVPAPIPARDWNRLSSTDESIPTMDMCNPADRVPQSDHAAAVADSPLREWKKGPDVAVQAPVTPQRKGFSRRGTATG